MRRFWLFPSFVLLAAGCPSDDTSETAEDTGTDDDADDDDDDDDDDDGSSSDDGPNPDSSSDGGSDTAEDTVADSSTTSPASFCGDGVVDEGEDCDDENMDNGDACSSECVIPFEIVWTATHNGSASNQDDANEVIVAEDGSIYVAGSERNNGTGLDVWVQQYMADGTEGWTFSWDGADGLDDSASSIAFDADGNLVIAGRTESADTVDDILVLNLDIATQELIGEAIVIDGPGSGADRFADLDSASDVAVDPDGLFVVVGSVRVDGQSYDAWTGKVDPAAMPSPVVWEQTLNGANSGPDSAAQVHVAEDGTVYTLANQEIADNDSNGVVLVYAADGTPQDADTVDFTFVVSDFAFDADGNVAISGWDEPENSGADILTALYDASFVEQWIAYKDGPQHIDDLGRAIAFDAAGHIATVGFVSVTGQAADAWVGTHQAADGAPWWGDAYQSESELDDQFNDVAATADGDFVVVGSESVLGEQRNAFVRVYHSL
jgi:cysteine-rich repeat protein